MLIGICSDTHGRTDALRKGLAIFDAAGIDRMVHCGDVGGTEVFDLLVGRQAWFVWGNTDFPDAATRAYLQTVGLPIPSRPPLLLEWADKTLAVYHGHEGAFDHAGYHPEVDYVLHGHTHLRRDDRLGQTRFINPGALHRARVKSVATLDLTTDTLTFHELDG
ncbi:MAG: metallophosphoesterase family protein [Phycisphaerae bacterium]